MQSNSWEDEITSIVINRSDIFKSSLKAINRKRFSYKKPLTVTFSGEEAVDTGGPKREYFTLLMKEVSALKLFHEGWFTHNLESLRNNEYYVAGQLIAWSILQGGGGPKCFSNEIYKFFKCGEKSAKLYDKISDRSLKEILTALDEIEDAAAFSNFLDSYADRICEFGYINIYIAKLVDKSDISHSLMNQFFKYSVFCEIQQFQNGMSSIGSKFGEHVWDDKALFELVLGEKKIDLDWQTFKNLFAINFSDKGSNKRSHEEESIYSWEMLLQDIKDGELSMKFEDLLVFITGASAIPPLGFDEKPTLNFYTNEDNVRRLPWSSTCTNALYLPRNCSPDILKEMIIQSVSEGHGFGKV